MRINKRIIIAAMLVIGIALFFWTQSRVPALNQKAMMGDRAVLTSIAFDIVLPIEEGQPFYQRVYRTTVNWAYTNWKGMTFGVLFAGAFLTLLRNLPRKSSNNLFVNSLKGMFTGVPLGVCVNCATPIAHGMHKAGVRLETVLATLISSPTLNVIVLTMLFAFLPLHFAIAKVLGVLIFVLVLIPLIVRLRRGGSSELDLKTGQDIGDQASRAPGFSAMRERVQHEAMTEGFVVGQVAATDNSWFTALWHVAVQYLKEFLYIFRTTVPFMLLAGFLGAIVIEAVPPGLVNELSVTPISMLLVALVGSFLPVPIAFDVIMVSVLLAAGIAPAFAMTLLFTLGIFSVYPFSVIWRNISGGIALSLFLATVLSGMLIGYLVQVYDSYASARTIEEINRSINSERYRDILLIAKKYCDGLETERESNSCLGDLIIRRFDDGYDQGLCEELREPEFEPGLRQACINAYQVGVVKLEAVSSEDTAVCDRIPLKAMQQRCVRAVIKERVKQGASIHQCDELSTRRDRDACMADAIVVKLAKFNDTRVCEELTDEAGKKDCLLNYELAQVKATGDAGACLKFEAEPLRDLCRQSLAFREIEAGNLDLRVCDAVKDFGLRSACTAALVSEQAKRAGDPALCDRIIGRAAGKSCVRAVADHTAENEISLLLTRRIQLQYGGLGMTSGTAGNDETFAELAAPPQLVEQMYQDDEISIAYLNYRDRNTGPDKPFSRLDGTAYGIESPWRFRISDHKEPFAYGKGIASGDFNNDHWQDLLLASDRGPVLLKNLGGKFIARHLDVPAEYGEPDAFVVAFVDIDNDGWLDIFLSIYGGRNYFILNDGKDFTKPEWIPLEGSSDIVTFAAAFADTDANGFLDFVLGNWSYGEEKAFNPVLSSNRYYMNHAMAFTPRALEEIKGETLSVLFTDFSNDGVPDLAIANDREVPDMYYMGKADGRLSLMGPDNGLIPVTPYNSMGIDSADVNNDGRLDLFSVDMSFSDGKDNYCELLDDAAAGLHCKMIMESEDVVKRGDAGWCRKRPDRQERDNCMVAILVEQAKRARQPEICRKIPLYYSVQRRLCAGLAEELGTKKGFSQDDYIPQVQSNRLLLQTEQGDFVDRTNDMGVAESFWSWNAKIADVDNDEWQDIYVGNGYRFGTGGYEIHSNVFYHNRHGEGFETGQDAFGLTDFVNTPSYTYIDLDNDGDLDIVATGVNAPVRVYRNNNTSNHGISFVLTDEAGNGHAVGARIRIFYGPEAGRQQLREIKLGGGFMSYDAPIAYFGLGQYTRVNRVEIAWPDGRVSHLERPFVSGKQYLITRTGS